MYNTTLVGEVSEEPLGKALGVSTQVAAVAVVAAATAAAAVVAAVEFLSV